MRGGTITPLQFFDIDNTEFLEMENFDMEKVSRLYARPEYKGKLKVEAGAKPCVSLKIQSKNRSIDEARRFVAAWSEN